VGAKDVVCGSNSSGDSNGGSWLQFVDGRGVLEEEDLATGQVGRCLSDIPRGGNKELIVTGIIRLCRQGLNDIMLKL
jgi:hypothetical protein